MDLQSIEREALEQIEKAGSLPEVEAVYIRFLGRKEGQLTGVLRNLGTLPPEEKKKVGQEANRVQEIIKEKITLKKSALEKSTISAGLEKERVDLTLPGYPFPHGHSHPVLQAIRDITAIFKEIGFDVAEGPEIEEEQNNFTDLNIPENHPARDMHDTFYLNVPGLLMRTHTSPVQIRVMKAMQPPVRLISPGRVFRNEATDATHAAVFHQVEGLMVDENVTFVDLRATLAYFAERFFGPETRVRFAPSYFPFVEPGAQMDVTCFSCSGKKVLPSGESCGLCKGSGWIEMMGAGLVHPQVLRNVGYDPDKVSGFAFGMGVERLVLMRSRIRDIRLLLESDMRFLEQF